MSQSGREGVGSGSRRQRAAIADATQKWTAPLAPELGQDVEAAVRGNPVSFGLKDDEIVKFGRIILHLWEAFLYGARRSEIGDDVLGRAISRSAEHIVKNLKCGKFPSDDKDVKTIACAHDCGQAATRIANGRKIDATIFNQAYDEVAACTRERLARVRKVFGADSHTQDLGLGC